MFAVDILFNVETIGSWHYNLFLSYGTYYIDTKSLLINLVVCSLIFLAYITLLQLNPLNPQYHPSFIMLSPIFKFQKCFFLNMIV